MKMNAIAMAIAMIVWCLWCLAVIIETKGKTARTTKQVKDKGGKGPRTDKALRGMMFSLIVVWGFGTLATWIFEMLGRKGWEIPSTWQIGLVVAFAPAVAVFVLKRWILISVKADAAMITESYFGGYRFCYPSGLHFTDVWEQFDSWVNLAMEPVSGEAECEVQGGASILIPFVSRVEPSLEYLYKIIFAEESSVDTIIAAEIGKQLQVIISTPDYEYGNGKHLAVGSLIDVNGKPISSKIGEIQDAISAYFFDDEHLSTGTVRPPRRDFIEEEHGYDVRQITIKDIKLPKQVSDASAEVVAARERLKALKTITDGLQGVDPVIATIANGGNPTVISLGGNPAIAQALASLTAAGVVKPGTQGQQPSKGKKGGKK